MAVNDLHVVDVGCGYFVIGSLQAL